MFQTIPTAILGLIIYGASWVLIGAIYGRAPKDGIKTNFIQVVSGLLTIAISTIIALAFVTHDTCSAKILAITITTMIASGLLGFYGMHFMSEGMQYGPNGAVWGITQSALVLPFAFGIGCYFTDPAFWQSIGANGDFTKPTVWRILGIISLLIGLVFYAQAKNNNNGTAYPKPKKLSWRTLAFLAFIFCATQQVLTTFPSYFEESRAVNPVVRTLFASLGGTLGFALHAILKGKETGLSKKEFIATVRRGRFWAYVLSMQAQGLSFSYLVLYNCMDCLGQANMAAVAYPIMVASCIVTFNIYTSTVLHEKLNLQQILAIIFCLLGIGGMCVLD